MSVQPKRFMLVHRYRISPHVYLETFDDLAVLLVADRDVVITVNLAAARLFAEANAAVEESPFSRSDCTDFLLAHFDMDRAEAVAQARVLLAYGLRHGLLLRAGER